MNNDKLTKDSVSVTLNKNRIKQSVLCCIYCGKSYKTKLVLDKHLVLCEVTHKSKTQINNDDEFVLPSQKQLYQIILELSLKCNRLESKVADLSKYINRKIEKVNIIDYLNHKEQPGVKFQDTAIILENKTKREVKNKKIVEKDLLDILENNGVSNAQDVLKDIINARKGTEISMQKIKIHPIKNKH